MSDEKDEHKGKVLNEDSLYGDEADSGVHRLASVREEDEAGAFGVKSPEELAEFVDKRISVQNIHALRRIMRNDFRNFAERHKWLSDFLGMEHIPPVTMHDIKEEENDRRLRGAKKAAMKGEDLRAFLEKPESTAEKLDENNGLIAVEEYAKYVAGKYRHLLEQGEFRKWRKIMLGFRDHYKPYNGEGAYREAFFTIIKTEAELAFENALMSKEPEKIAECFIYAGAIKLFESEDLLDVPAEIFQAPEVKNAFREPLRKLFGEHPEMYFRARNHLLKLGFFKDKDEADSDPGIVEEAKKALEDAVILDPGLLANLRDLFVKEGFDAQFNEKDEEQIRQKIFQFLRSAAKISPGKYMALRNQLELLKLMDGEMADSDDEVRWSLQGHFLNLKEIHPWMLQKLRFYWRANGLKVMDEVATENFSNHPDAKLRKNPREGLKTGHKPIPKDLAADQVAQRAIIIFEQEKRLYDEHREELHKISREFVDNSGTKLPEVEMKYPQYDSKNSGRGYLGDRIKD